MVGLNGFAQGMPSKYLYPDGNTAILHDTWSFHRALDAIENYSFRILMPLPSSQSSHEELAEECQSRDNLPNDAVGYEVAPECKRATRCFAGTFRVAQLRDNLGLFFTQGDLEN